MKHMKKRTWGRWLAGLLSVVMVLALLSAAALAEDETLPAQDEQTVDGTETPSGGGEAAPAPDGTPEPDPESTETPDTGAASDPESSDAPAPAQQVQALIDALPDAESITAETRADVQAQLDAIAAAMLELTEDEAAALDTARYDAAAALSALGDQTADPDPDPDPAPNSDSEPGAGPSALEQVQALIDALPDAEEITAETRADVEEQLNAIDEAKLALGDEERDALDVTRYMAAVAALSALDGQAGADEPEAMAFPDGFSGSGTSGDPYLIENAEQLKQLSEYVKGGKDCQDTYFKLTGNINLGGSQSDQWTPIGNRDHHFQGTFDGNNCKISELYVTSTTAGYESGFFGYVGDLGTVKNLSVSGYVSGNTFVGGIVAHNEGTISNCSFDDGTVTYDQIISSVDVGGITGYNNKGSINNCRNNGNVINKSADVGGIVGSNHGPVTNCSNSGEITGEGQNTSAGGIIGSNVRSEVTGCINTGRINSSRYPAGIVSSNINGTISNCYNTGSVGESSNFPGGIVGSSNRGTIENCYNSGTINGSNSGNIIGYAMRDTLTNCYFISGSIVGSGNYTGEATEKSSDAFASGEVAWLLQNGQDEQVWGQTLPTDKFPVLTSDTTKRVCKVTFQADGDEFDAKYTNNGSNVDLPVPDPTPSRKDFAFANWACNSERGTIIFDNRTEITDDTTVYAQWKLGDIGLTTEENPYIIPDLETLKAFRNYVNAGNSCQGMYFKLTENIVLGGADDPWTPVGGSDNPFKGTFDGNNKTISGLYIERRLTGVFQDTSHQYVGLFGFISNGSTVKNLTVEGKVIGGSYVGGIVGLSDGGTVDNCHNAATVEGSSDVGGIVGSSQNSAIKNCRNTGKINGGDSTGGIVGMSRSGGPIENCHNTADITGSGASAGGVVGVAYDITVSGCSNTGAVSGTDNIGGVAGQINSFSSDGVIQNCCNTGAVTGTGSSNIGGVVGMNSSNCTTENCYNTGAVNGKGGVGGVAGLNSGTVKNCYNTGAVKVTAEYGRGGGVVGLGSGTCTDCYYLESCGATGQGTPKADGAFASGEVAWLLQKDQSSPVWGQTVNSGTPELTASPEKKVFQITGVVEEQDDVVWYSNSKASLPAAQPAKEGFTFAGWSTEEARTKADLVKDFPVSNDMTVYAVFTVIHQRVDGTGTVTMADYTCGDNSVEPVAESATNGTGNVKFTYSERGRDAFSETKPTKAGEYTVKAVFAATDDYNEVTATTDFKITHQFNAGWEQRDNGRYRLCACGTGLLLETKTLTEVPEGLKQVPAVDTVEEIERVLAEQVAAGDHYVVYDVELETLVDGAWVIVTPESLPDEGVAVTVPYPEGTNAKDLFTVVHMFTTAGGGHVPGDTETLKAANEADGIHFTLQSFSPVLIGWKTAEPSAAPTDNRPGNAPNTGDETPLALWSSLMVISLIGVTAIALPPLMGKKKPLSTNGRHMRK